MPRSTRFITVRCLAVLACLVLTAATLRADLSFTQTMTIEGGAAALMGPANKPVTMTNRIKGTTARVDVDLMDTAMSVIVDMTSKQATLLNHAEKTAQTVAVTAAGTAPLTPPADMPVPTVEGSFKATGQTRTIDGVSTDEHTLALTITMGEMSGGQMPPEALEMMKDVKFVIHGSLWLAKTGPGAAEYMAFQKAAAGTNPMSMLGNILSQGRSPGGLDKLFAAMSEAPGLPYLTEMTMSVEGTGQMAQMLKQQVGSMKLVQKTTAISTDPVPDDLFKVPADYTVKQ